MDLQRKKELLYEWNNRHPEMGVIAIVCKETGDAFLTISKDTSVGFNRHRFQLPANMHPNKALQALWNQYGESGFAYTVVKVLECKDPLEDYTEELEEMLEQCLAEMPKAKKM